MIFLHLICGFSFLFAGFVVLTYQSQVISSGIRELEKLKAKNKDLPEKIKIDMVVTTILDGLVIMFCGWISYEAFIEFFRMLLS